MTCPGRRPFAWSLALLALNPLPRAWGSHWPIPSRLLDRLPGSGNLYWSTSVSGYIYVEGFRTFGRIRRWAPIAAPHSAQKPPATCMGAIGTCPARPGDPQRVLPPTAMLGQSQFRFIYSQPIRLSALESRSKLEVGHRKRWDVLGKDVDVL